MSNIELKHIAKSYGPVPVLNDISLSITEGEFVVLVGPSGCGKSTLLRMVAGLEDITDGDLLIDGEISNGVPAKQRDLAMVFQSYALYPHMKVADNMSFALKLAGVSKAEIKQRVTAAAEILGLDELLDRLPRELSGGQRQRVAMGRAIVRDPQAFLFDEPLSNLDAKLRVKMRSEIKKLHKRLGKTMLYVTHDQTEAMTMADRIVVLNQGDIAQVGAPLEVYSDPDSVFVAGFIGSPEINLLSATTAGSKAKYVELDGGTKLAISHPIDRPKGTPITCGVRPQHIELAAEGIPAQVTLIEPTGEELEVTVRVGDIDMSIIVRGHPDLTIGEKVHLKAGADKVLLFDTETGERIRLNT